tara:strand:- start:2490 stop:3155 length:666 start_codon:yes stop_codon:yes gene_type:complete
MPKKTKEPISKFFQDNKYITVKNALSFELATFVYSYFQNKRNVARHLLDNKHISPYDKTWGYWEDDDDMIPGTYSHYSDMAMETIMVRMLPVIKQVTGIAIAPAYSYARIYKHGDYLFRHKDRPSCEISCTINLGGDMWPIYLEPSGEKGKEGISINLNAGDMLVYRGYDLEHWRPKFEGHECGQVFCHYVDTKGPYVKEYSYDSREMIGLPAYTRLLGEK